MCMSRRISSTVIHRSKGVLGARHVREQIRSMCELLMRRHCSSVGGMAVDGGCLGPGVVLVVVDVDTILMDDEMERTIIDK